DLADEKKNKLWKAYFQEKGFFVVELDARRRNGMKAIQDTILESCKEKIERDRRRGIKNRPIRAMVVGIPNVGKSTFINTFAGKAVAKTGNRPGVTKGKQWIRLNKNAELLDTPGILWPKFDDQAVGMRLAWIGSMNDSIINTDELAVELIRFLVECYPGVLEKRYGFWGQQVAEKKLSAQQEPESPVEILGKIAINRNCIRSGGEFDYSKAAILLIDDFRSGRLGRITLETPDEKSEMS
ncbi:MAG: ribosome biogenesis GTPase YlqF, partial [Clostridiales bacterium]|nr:ribosome biogenesis GTPase YlqF [Clostridiales bacterium]